MVVDWSQDEWITDNNAQDFWIWLSEDFDWKINELNDEIRNDILIYIKSPFANRRGFDKYFGLDSTTYSDDGIRYSFAEIYYNKVINKYGDKIISKNSIYEIVKKEAIKSDRDKSWFYDYLDKNYYNTNKQYFSLNGNIDILKEIGQEHHYFKRYIQSELNINLDDTIKTPNESISNSLCNRSESNYFIFPKNSIEIEREKKEREQYLKNKNFKILTITAVLIIFPILSISLLVSLEPNIIVFFSMVLLTAFIYYWLVCSLDN